MIGVFDMTTAKEALERAMGKPTPKPKDDTQKEK